MSTADGDDADASSVVSAASSYSGWGGGGKATIADELNRLRESGNVKTHRGKYKSSDASGFMTPEEARAFLAAQRAAQSRKSAQQPTPPTNMNSADLDGWYMQRRKQELELRRKREEAEQILRGYKGHYVPRSRDATPQRTRPSGGSVAGDIDDSSVGDARGFFRDAEANAQPLIPPSVISTKRTKGSSDGGKGAEGEIVEDEISHGLLGPSDTIDDDDVKDTAQVHHVEKEDGGNSPEETKTSDDELQDDDKVDSESKPTVGVSEVDSPPVVDSVDSLASSSGKEADSRGDVPLEEGKLLEEKSGEKEKVGEEDVPEVSTMEDGQPEEEKVPGGSLTEQGEPEHDMTSEGNEALPAEGEMEASAGAEGPSFLLSEEDQMADVADENTAPEAEDGQMADSDLANVSTKDEEEEKKMEEEVGEQSPMTDSGFNNFVSTEPGAPYPPESGRYHLYVSYACPWAHRTLMVLAMKGLQNVISITALQPVWQRTCPDDPNDDHMGWIFGHDGEDNEEGGSSGSGVITGFENEPDPVMSAYSIRDVYEAAGYKDGKFTIPVLFDKNTRTIVSTESSDIVRMLNSSFNTFAKKPELDLFPESLRSSISEVNSWIHPRVNNGVFRCGFATTQEAYNEAMKELTESFDKINDILQNQQFIAGDVITEADIGLFVTLIRFDEIYAVYFKTNARSVAHTPAMLNYCRSIYAIEGVAGTCDMDQIKAHYYCSHAELNKYSIVPWGPNFMNLLRNGTL